jgi:stage V sporulation protein B
MMIKPAIATVVMAVISYLSYLSLIHFGVYEAISTIVGILIAVAVYAIMILILRILSKEDILSLPKGEKIYKILNKLKIYA